MRACGRTSPAFTIQDAPEGTERLRFVMIDKDAPNFRHGGSTILYNGSGRVPEGARQSRALHPFGDAERLRQRGKVYCE
ncbi:MAG: YbhB/YbcL family Raf kinase inhibitor-like protein [Methylocella sp.]